MTKPFLSAFDNNSSEVSTYSSATELLTTSVSTCGPTVSAQAAGTVGMIVSSIAVIANVAVLVQ